MCRPNLRIRLFIQVFHQFSQLQTFVRLLCHPSPTEIDFHWSLIAGKFAFSFSLVCSIPAVPFTQAPCNHIRSINNWLLPSKNRKKNSILACQWKVFFFWGCLMLLRRDRRLPISLGMRLTPEKAAKSSQINPLSFKALTPVNDEPKWFSAHFTLSREPFFRMQNERKPFCDELDCFLIEFAHKFTPKW